MPLLIATLLFLLLVPRGTTPTEVPLPPLDSVALAKVAATDAQFAARAQTKGLDADIRAVGSALAALHATLDAATPSMAAGGPTDRTREVDLAADGIADEIKRIRDARGSEAGLIALLELRALQLQEFLIECRELRRTGVASETLLRLASPLVRKLTSFGWIRETNVAQRGDANSADSPHLVPNDAELTVLFKRLWNTETGLAPILSPARRLNASLGGDEHSDAEENPYAETTAERILLHRLNLRAPHPETASLVRLALAKKAAATPGERQKALEDEALSRERFRVSKLADVLVDDPDYPIDYALGVALYGAHDYEHSAEALLRYTELHPAGDYALRARHHLAAVLRARDR